MPEVIYTLVADGSSDRALIPIINWCLRENSDDIVIKPQWADLGRFSRQNRRLSDRIRIAIDFYPADLIIIHRDAERDSVDIRQREIESAVRQIFGNTELPYHTCLIPVRMTEAWLLINEQAIRIASGNRNGNVSLNVPRLRDLEALPDPKQILFELIQQASGLSGRRLKKLNVHQSAIRVTEHIEDFSPLRSLPAFHRFETELGRIMPYIM